MIVIQKGKAYSRIKLSPEEIDHIYFALMAKIGFTLTAKQRASADVIVNHLDKQLTMELELSEEFDKLRKSNE